MNKASLRVEYLQRRNNLKNRAQLTRLISETTIKYLSFTKPKVVHVFLPIVEKGEINTWPIIEYLFSEGITVVVPISDFKTHTMQAVELLPHTTILTNAYGIPEPNSTDYIDPYEIDVVLAPLLVADTFGHRLGYGKGFYDRFFLECRKETKKVGLSLFDPIHHLPETTEWDVCLDILITPTNTHFF